MISACKGGSATKITGQSRRAPLLPPSTTLFPLLAADLLC